MSGRHLPVRQQRCLWLVHDRPLISTKPMGWEIAMSRDRNVLFWLAIAVAVVLLIMLLRDILLPFVAGIVIAYFLNPAADRLEAWGMGRIWATLLIVVVAGTVLVVALIFLVPLLVNQMRQLVTTLPDQLVSFRSVLESWARNRLGDSFPTFQSGLEKASKELQENWTVAVRHIVSSLWNQGLALVNFLSLLLITPVVVFYLLVDWHRMIAKIDGWLPRAQAQTIRTLASEVNGAIAAFIRGQGTLCLVLGTLYAVGLTWAGLKYGLLIGIATGVMSFVPFVGFALGLTTATIVAIVQFSPDWIPLLKVLAVFAAGQALDAGFLSPKIVGGKIGLHPVWLIFSLFAFSYIFGFVGILVAVPIAAALAVIVRFALRLYLESAVYTGGSAADPPAEPNNK